jgi:hypothetical protein
MTKRPLERSPATEKYLLLVSERLGLALHPPLLQKGNTAVFPLATAFTPRLCGYHPTKTPKPDVVRIYYTDMSPDGKCSPRKKMAEYDFSTVDLEEILPSLETAKLSDPSDKGSDESGEEKAEDEEEAEDDDDEDEDVSTSGSSSSSSSFDDPKDADFKELTIAERIAACPEDTIYWQPQQSYWEFHFAVKRDPPHLQLSQLKFRIERKKKEDRPAKKNEPS